VETTNIVRMTRINESRGRLTIDNLIKIFMEKSVFNVKLMNGLGVGESQRKN
jgi:hypothetical protein